jgi:hypothetical protein
LELAAACVLLSTGSMRMYYRTVKPLMERIGLRKSNSKETIENTETNTENMNNNTNNPSEKQ